MATRRFYKKGKKEKKGNKKTQKNHKKPRLVVYGKIYANWCGHCRAMEPDWKRLEKRMRPLKSVNIESEEKDHKIAAFNKKHKTNLALKGGFPTLFKLPENGGPVKYYEGGDRSEDALHAWLNESGGSEPESVHLQREENQNLNKNNNFLANLF
jgi:thiol-disulfide isomerase/thioredoxin